MKYLLSILCLFVFSCDSDNVVEFDLCGVLGGDHINDEGYHCGDIQVLQDIIDSNPSLSSKELEPLDLTSLEWNNDGRLVELHISGFTFGDLTSVIPENIGDLTELTYLGFDYNQMYGSVPESIGNLIHLETLKLNDNQFTSIPSTIGNLINLDAILSFGNNNLTSLPESLCDIPDDCSIRVYGNLLCNEYHYSCVTYWEAEGAEQDQSNCCEGVNDEGKTDPNWTTCP